MMAGALGSGLFAQSMITCILRALEDVEGFDQIWFKELLVTATQSLEESKPYDDRVVGSAFDHAIVLMRKRIGAIGQT